MARWPVHPAWLALQRVYCTEEGEVIDTTTGEVSFEPASSVGMLIRERIRQVNILQLTQQISGCTSTLAAWLGGRQDDRPVHAVVGLLDVPDRVPVPEQIYDYHAVLHWLHDQMPRHVMAAQAARVAPEHPEILWKNTARNSPGM